MTIFAGTNWIARMINRWRARQSMGALLRRMDDHTLDDIGVTRDDLRRAFGAWRNEQAGIYNAAGTIPLSGGHVTSHPRASAVENRKPGFRVEWPNAPVPRLPARPN